ncbi:MAG: transcriptional repressor LexA [Spirochaetes bacterium]|nr:transcriptional repressor LexA [Spirochaetota bacterium]MBU1079658.1 transcriptional repressor LexA [Spirochaetota bacterium]
MNDLTDRQKEVLDYIEAFIETNPYPPTIREIAANFGMSVKGAYDHLKALERKGRIRAGGGRSRKIEIIGKSLKSGRSQTIEVPVLGSVAAGKPIFAEENYESSVHVPTSMVGAQRCFALRVRGDSMIKAGILDGDIAVIEQRQVAADGEIVVAAIEDSVTLKRFFKEKSRIRLEPENDSYAPIFTQDARILGKLRGIVRTY